MSQPVHEPTVTSPPASPPAGRAAAPLRGRRASGPARAPGRRHARVVIRKVRPWSVFKVSLIFYGCLMLAFLGAGVILYAMLGAIGALDSTTRLVRDLFSDQSFEINGRWLFTRAVGVGLLFVLVWSLINVFVAFLYNLIADLVGGVEVTLAERR